MLTISVLAGVGLSVGVAIAFTHPAKAQVVYLGAPTTEKGIAPVLQRIINCESGGNQFRDGQVLIAVNTNGTYDQGIAQINSIHNKEASKLGFDLSTEQGNIGYATFLYENRGTSDWYSSQKCWQK